MAGIRTVNHISPDHRLAKAFHISVYSLAALAGAMMAFGEESVFPAALSVPLAALAYWFNERYRTLRVPAYVANTLGLIALTYAIFEFFSENIEARLLSGAHFLVYLSWVILFQEKRIRQYWWLCGLGLLQVAVGSVLTLAPWYGLMMLCFMFLSLWTLSLFTLYQSALEFGLISADGVAIDAGAATAPAESLEATPAVAAIATPWQIFDSRAPMHVVSGVIRPPSGQWLERSSFLRISGIAVAGLSLALMLFLAIPRVWVGSANPFATRTEMGTRPLTGFTSEVRLGQLGQILESTELVMQVCLYDRKTEEKVSIDEFARQQGMREPLFRGTVLDLYSSGRWAAGAMGDRNHILRSHPRQGVRYRQEYTLEPIGTDILFAMRPITLGVLDPYQAIAVDLDSGTLTSMRGDNRERVNYLIYTSALGPDERPQDTVPPLFAMSRMAQQRCLLLPAERLPRLRELAQELTRVEEANEVPNVSEQKRKAKALESFFLDGNRFTYSLNMEVRDPMIDPVEDFLFNRKTGHCEYFASALALMLRSVGIPSRLVSGFKGAEYNRRLECFEVQQRHAHAWVEAFVDREWIVLDPTPGGRDESVRSVGSTNGFWKNARSSLNSLWSNYVVTLSYNRQKQELYDPLQTSVTDGLKSVRGGMDDVKDAIQWIRLMLMSPEVWFSWQGLVFTFVFLSSIVVVVQTFRWGLRRVRLRRAAQRLRGQVQRRLVPFYERFLELMQSIDRFPAEAQTAQEFAAEIRSEWGSRLESAGLSSFPERLAQLFYRVRFAEQTLDPREEAELARQFELFSQLVAARNSHA